MQNGIQGNMFGQNPSGKQMPVQVDGNGYLIISDEPPAAEQTQIIGASGNVANAAAVATLAAVAGKTTYIDGFVITGTGATAAGVVEATLTGLLGGTMTFIIAVPAGVNTGLTPLVVNFPKPLPASAVDTAIVLTLPALGSGNTNAAVNAHGFQQ